MIDLYVTVFASLALALWFARDMHRAHLARDRAALADRVAALEDARADLGTLRADVDKQGERLRELSNVLSLRGGR